MSYSFQVRAATSTSVAELVAAQFDAVVDNQPVHAADREAAESAVSAMLATVGGREGRDFSVTVSGSVVSDEDGLTTAGVSVSVTLVEADTSSLTSGNSDSGGGGHGDPDKPGGGG